MTIYGIPEDYSDEEMLRNLSAGITDFDTICDQHKEIYRAIINLPGKTRVKILKHLIKAHKMAKKMSNKLLYYKNSEK